MAFAQFVVSFVLKEEALGFRRIWHEERGFGCDCGRCLLG